ncbi:MAG TPA: hypothetical protein VFT53_05800 [Candidatus Saccharimonadales bacterium]|nr:hypothetical protein [Candidatus Saccharimonadales bacterium]
MAYESPGNSAPEPESDEDIARYNEIGDFVADTLGVDSDMSDEEWERLYNLGIDYYYYQNNPLPEQQ